MARDTVAFISYAREDGEAFATALRERVEKEQPEISLWQDRARMRGGEDFAAQIREAVESVQYLVLVLTPAALRSTWVRKEWRYAREQGVCVCPVKGPPHADTNALRAALPRWMSQAHAYDLDKEWERFVLYLKSPCTATRVPFMAAEQRAGYVERRGEATRIVTAVLDATRQNPGGKPVAIWGAGGFGKTSLAVNVCHDGEVMSACDGGILWATLGEQPALLPELTKLYAALTGERPSFVDADDASLALSSKLEGKRCLLVIDDVWDVEHVKPFMRGGAECTRLMTTRSAKIAADFATEDGRIYVGEMSPEEAERFLAAGIEPAPVDLAPFRKLAARLGEWPLLIELANSVLNDQMRDGETLQGALDWIGHSLDRLGVVAFDREDAELRKQAVAKTVEVSLTRLKDQRLRCLELAIFPEDVQIPLSALGIIWKRDEFDTRRLAQRLNELSLVQLNLPARSLRVHDAMRAYFATQLPADDNARLHGMLGDAWQDLAKLTDDYARHHVVYHLVTAMAQSAQTVLRANQLARLLTDATFREQLQQHADPVALNRLIGVALQQLADSAEPQAAVLLVALAVAGKSFVVERQPRWIFDLARQGKVDDALLRLALFDAEPEWAVCAKLLVAWLAPNSSDAQTKALADTPAAQPGAAEANTLREWVRLRPLGVPAGLMPLPPPPPLYTISAMLERAGGSEGNATGIEPLNLEMIVNLAASGIDAAASGFIAENDGAPLVAFARADPQENTQYLQRYIAIHAANRYRYYRNRSLWALMKFVLAASDAAWVREQVEALVTGALTVTTVDFCDAVPLAVWALRAKGGDAQAMQSLDQYHQRLLSEVGLLSPARGKSDSWAHYQRSAAALAEAYASMGRRADADALLELARNLPKGFAGFRATAALTLAETVQIAKPADPPLRDQFLLSAQAASERIQDYPFCLQTVAQVRAVRSRWWPTGALDLDNTINRLLLQPLSAEFCSVHQVGVPFEFRGNEAHTLPIPEEIRNASTLRKLAEIHRLTPEALRAANPWDLDQPLAPGTDVNTPDAEFTPLLAARLAAEALASAPPALRTRLIQRLVLPAAANLTALDTVLARLLLSTADTPLMLPLALLDLKPAAPASEALRNEALIA